MAKKDVPLRKIYELWWKYLKQSQKLRGLFDLLAKKGIILFDKRPLPTEFKVFIEDLKDPSGMAFFRLFDLCTHWPIFWIDFDEFWDKAGAEWFGLLAGGEWPGLRTEVEDIGFLNWCHEQFCKMGTIWAQSRPQRHNRS